MKYAIVNNGVVENFIVWDGISQWDVPPGCTLIPVPDGTFAEIGATYDGTVFTAPVVSSPTA